MGRINTEIGEAVYEEFPAIARRMRELGMQLNDQIIRAYLNVHELREDWHGIRYDDLCKAFSNDNLLHVLNATIRLAAQTYPVVLEKIANNYSLTDRGTNICTVNDVPPKVIQPIEPALFTSLRFIDLKVRTAQKNIEKDFQDSIQTMNDIEVEFNKITWNSLAAENYKRAFQNGKRKIIQNIEQLKQNMSNNINAAAEDYGVAENNNNVENS